MTQHSPNRVMFCKAHFHCYVSTLNSEKYGCPEKTAAKKITLNHDM
jgi:hypothetical protein